MAGQLTIDTLKASSGVLATQNGMTGICKAWVNYKATATVGIRSSFNVSSVTYNSAGNYTVNFTNAMVDANYSTVGSTGGYNGGSSASSNATFRINSANGATYSTSSVQVTTGYADGVVIDYLYVNVIVCGN